MVNRSPFFSPWAMALLAGGKYATASNKFSFPYTQSTEIISLKWPTVKNFTKNITNTTAFDLLSWAFGRLILTTLLWSCN